MAQDGGDGFVVASALDAAGGEAVAEGVEPDGRNAQPGKEPSEIGPIISGLVRR